MLEGDKGFFSGLCPHTNPPCDLTCQKDLCAVACTEVKLTEMTLGDTSLCVADVEETAVGVWSLCVGEAISEFLRVNLFCGSLGDTNVFSFWNKNFNWISVKSTVAQLLKIESYNI